MMKILHHAVIAGAMLLAFATAPASARDITVEDLASWNRALASARPGDSLVLKAGEWRDAQIIFRARGTKAEPITLKVERPGETVLTGKSMLRIGGEHLIIEGLLFKDPDPTVSDLIQFRIDSDELASHCRMKNCAVVSTAGNDSSGENRWVGLYGSGHRVDQCAFQGKADKGPMLVVWLGDDNIGQHQIDHNYFGPREKLGKNGGETIRIGDSKTSMLDADCVVERNLFERCNGEVECISNKSCGNIYRENTFLEVGGTLTLRHGNGCLVERNVFLGNDVRGTGGIRIIGEDHVVRGNYLEGLTGDGGRSALCLMMGIPDSPLHRYFQVKRAIVENNTIVDCEHPLLIGLREDKIATLAPADTIIRDNIIFAPERVIVEARCALDGIAWANNNFAGKSLGIPATEGIRTDAARPQKLKPISRAAVGPDWFAQ